MNVLIRIALMMGSEAITLFLVALLALAALRLAGRDRSITQDGPALSRRWYLWLAGAAAAFGVGLLAVATDGDNELNTVRGATWMFSWAAAMLLRRIGLTLGATRIVTGRR